MRFGELCKQCLGRWGSRYHISLGWTQWTEVFSLGTAKSMIFGGITDRCLGRCRNSFIAMTVELALPGVYRLWGRATKFSRPEGVDA